MFFIYCMFANLTLYFSGSLQGGVWKEQGERLQRGGRHSRDAETEEDARPSQ